MKKSKEYPQVVFTASAFQKIVSEFKDIVKDPSKTKFGYLKVQKGRETWLYETFEEFQAELRDEFYYAEMSIDNPDLSINITIWRKHPNIVSISSSSRENILRLSNVVDICAEECYVAPPPELNPPKVKPKIFIGHGGSPQWRDLKDHLQDLHGYEIIAYETGSRAGHAIRDIIAEMLEKSSFAILVMTGEDRTEDGCVRARQNVIHEIGLFQGRLGFSKAIVLKEEETEDFSNLAGAHQIRYSKGNIKETFGEVLAVLRREFGEI